MIKMVLFLKMERDTMKEDMKLDKATEYYNIMTKMAIEFKGLEKTKKNLIKKEIWLS